MYPIVIRELNESIEINAMHSTHTFILQNIVPWINIHETISTCVFTDVYFHYEKSNFHLFFNIHTKNIWNDGMNPDQNPNLTLMMMMKNIEILRNHSTQTICCRMSKSLMWVDKCCQLLLLTPEHWHNWLQSNWLNLSQLNFLEFYKYLLNPWFQYDHLALYNHWLWLSAHEMQFVRWSVQQHVVF